MVDYPSYTSLVLPICVALPVWYWLRRQPKSTLPHPPGPKGYPLIGNALDFPRGIPLWEGLASMAKQYGGICHVCQYSRLHLTSFDHRHRRSLP